MDAAAVGAGRRAVRAQHQRDPLARAERLQRLGARLARADRPLPPPALRGEIRDAYAVTEAEAGSDPSRIASVAEPRRRRRLPAERREVVRHLRRRRLGAHRDGQRGRRRRAPPHPLPGRRRRARRLDRRQPALHPQLSRRPPDLPLRRGRAGRRRGDRRGRRRRRPAARVVHRGAPRDRRPRDRRDVAAARRDGRVGGERASRAAAGSSTTRG